MSARTLRFSALVAAALVGATAFFALPAASPKAAVATDSIAVPTTTEWTKACEDWDDWDKPGPPFRIHGNSYYVGTCGIAAILIAGSDGHVLIDGGAARGADLIAANITKLGFRLSDVKLLLMSHEHFDHVGGLARLQELSGAKLLSSPAARPVMETGDSSREDPQADLHPPFDPARVDGEVLSGVPVKLGNLSLTPLATPGHTPGALTWEWQSCETDDCRTIVYADSLSPISGEGYRFSDHGAYLDAFRSGLANLAALAPCDILLTPHPSASDLRNRLMAGNLDAPPRCAEYAEGIGRRLDERLAEEASQ